MKSASTPDNVNSLLDEQAAEILSNAVKQVPQEVWNSIAAAEQTVSPVETPIYMFSSSGTSNAIN